MISFYSYQSLNDSLIDESREDPHCKMQFYMVYSGNSPSLKYEIKK